MKNYSTVLFSGLVLIVVLYSCAASDMGSATRNENLSMNIKEERNIISAEKLPKQDVPTMDERGLSDSGTRGLLGPVAGSLVSLATNAVKKIIANDQKKYMAAYQFGITDLYFYDQLSSEGPFDPVGLQFGGFKVIRTFINKEGNTDTAMIAEFALDTSKTSEMINSSIFRLRLKEFQLRYAKAKVRKSNDLMLNMDFEITFLTSYVNSDGLIFDSVTLGKFYLFFRNAPLDSKQAGYKEYYEKMKDSLLLGKSFIVPRSFGYYRSPANLMRPSYSQGAYSIQVKVKESSKNNFVNQLIMENSNLLIDATGNQLKSTLNKKL